MQRTVNGAVPTSLHLRLPWKDVRGRSSRAPSEAFVSSGVRPFMCSGRALVQKEHPEARITFCKDPDWSPHHPSQVHISMAGVTSDLIKDFGTTVHPIWWGGELPSGRALSSAVVTTMCACPMPGTFHVCIVPNAFSSLGSAVQLSNCKQNSKMTPRTSAQYLIITPKGERVSQMSLRPLINGL